MGSFNTLIINAECVRCHLAFIQRIQFKFGLRWQYEYKPGDKLVRGDPHYDKGERSLARVIVSGCLENEFCPHCQFENPWLCDVIVENDILKCIRPERDPDKFGDEEYYEE